MRSGFRDRMVGSMKRLATVMLATGIVLGSAACGNAEQIPVRRPISVTHGGGLSRSLVAVAADGTPIFSAASNIWTSNGGTIRIKRRSTLIARSFDGRVRWQREVGSGWWVRTVEESSDGGVLAGCDATLVALDSSGNVRWTATFSGYLIDGVAPGADGVAYAFGQRRNADGSAESDWASLVVALSPTGDVVWKNKITELGDIDYDRGPDYDVTVSAAAVGSDGTLYVGTTSHLIALSPEGDRLWSWSTHSYADVNAILTGRHGVVYAVGGDAGSNGFVRAFDRDGDELWVGQTGSSAYAGALGRDGSVYADTGDKLFRFRGVGASQ
jgi:hypothetical protein